MSRKWLGLASRLKGGIGVGLLAIVIPGPFAAWADTLPPVDPNDPLFAFCYGGTACTPDPGFLTTSNPSPNFGFYIAPVGPQSATFTVEILVPDNEFSKSAVFTITGTGTGATLPMNASLFSKKEWMKGSLWNYLGFSQNSTPSNLITDFLPETQRVDPAAQGYLVYQAPLGTTTLQKQNKELKGPLLHLNNLPLGALVVSFLCCDVHGQSLGVATTIYDMGTSNNGGALFETTPLPAALPMMGSVMGLGIAFAGWRRRRVRNMAAPKVGSVG
jgi:hypothetical protein